MQKRRLMTSLAICLVLAACKKEDPLIGRWQEVDGNGRSEYFTDGSAIVNDGSIPVSGPWKRLEDGRLKIEATVMGPIPPRSIRWRLRAIRRRSPAPKVKWRSISVQALRQRTLRTDRREVIL